MAFLQKRPPNWAGGMGEADGSGDFCARKLGHLARVRRGLVSNEEWSVAIPVDALLPTPTAFRGRSCSPMPPLKAVST